MNWNYQNGLRSVFLLGFLLTLLSSCERQKVPVYFKDEPPVDFSFTNQQGKTITGKSLKNKVYVADFFFSTCPGVCKDMTAQMRKVQDFTRNLWDVKLVSFSVDPETDSVARLKEYGINFGVMPEKWHLLTGEYEKVFDLAQKTFHVSALKDEKAEGGVFHDERIMLIDKRGRIRGFYHLTDSVKFKQLLREIDFLRKET